ncbi:hypothetical protein T4D_5079 [Trichinella pseudospiralis]|uniref:Ig-like domain-containing protein n=1 Tax=Trichinella pseudospiralis TaxID=6337 RepID=A0A0V1F9A2_TRIPS|nr:hypothetical protein T4D_5079 [Trichinella pseudospiralis]
MCLNNKFLSIKVFRFATLLLLFASSSSSTFSSPLSTQLIIFEVSLLDKYNTDVYFLHNKSTVRLKCSCANDSCPAGTKLRLVQLSSTDVGVQHVLAESEIVVAGDWIQYDLRMKESIVGQIGNYYYACQLMNVDGVVEAESAARWSGLFPRFCSDNENGRPSLCGDRFSSFCIVYPDQSVRYCEHMKYHWCSYLQSVQRGLDIWKPCMLAGLDDGHEFVVEQAAPSTCHAVAMGREVHYEVTGDFSCSTSDAFLDVRLLDTATTMRWNRLEHDSAAAVQQNKYHFVLAMVHWSGGGSVDCDLLGPSGVALDSVRLQGASPQLARFNDDGAGSELLKLVCSLRDRSRAQLVARSAGLVLLWNPRTEIWPPLVQCGSVQVLRCRFVAVPGLEFALRIFWTLEQQVLAESNGTYVDLVIGQNKPGRYTCVGQQRLKTHSPPVEAVNSASSYIDLPSGCLQSHQQQQQQQSRRADGVAQVVRVPFLSSELQKADRLLDLLLSDKLDHLPFGRQSALLTDAYKKARLNNQRFTFFKHKS